MELGQAFRGEHAEIMSFVSGTVNSELSGNMIDLCPVGALTSKPFRYKARSWELSRRRSVSAHDSLGSNLAVQTKNNRVLRVLPIENEDINECWLSDKDRFAYEGLNSAERLTKPMIKQDGKWQEVEWQVALEYAANGLRHIANGAGAEQVGALATANSTLEELYLLQKLMRGIGSQNVDFRLRQSDFSADGKQQGAPWLGMSIADISRADRFLIVGSFLRKDHPLLAARIRQAVKKGAQANILHSADDDLLMKVTNKAIVAPDALVEVLTQVRLAESAGSRETKDRAVQAAKQRPSPGVWLAANASQCCSATLRNNIRKRRSCKRWHNRSPRCANGKFGFLGEAANSVGGYLAQATPGAQGLNAASMLATPRKAYVLLNVEAGTGLLPIRSKPSLRCKSADTVIALSAYKHHAMEYADVLLPIAPFTETSGTFVSTEGRVQSFKGAVKPLGEARPAWKVLRVLGNLLKVDGFDQDTSEAVRDEALKGVDVAARLNNAIGGVEAKAAFAANGLQRVSDVPIYATDAVVRRSAPLQATADAAIPQVWLHSDELKKLGVQAGASVKVSQGQGSVQADCGGRR